MNIVGAVVVGHGEGDRWLDPFLTQLHPLCDRVIICENNTDKKTKQIIRKHRFYSYEDNREWGIYQPYLKQNLVLSHAAKFKPDWILALDADEFLDKRLTRRKLEELGGKPYDLAYYFWCVELWNSEHTHNWNMLFEDMRYYRYLPGKIVFRKAPVHCGSGPEYAYTYGTRSEFIFRHYGLMRKEDRDRKVERYKKYDPNQKHLNPAWYKELAAESPNLKEFNEESFIKEIPETVYKKYPCMPYDKEHTLVKGQEIKKLWRFLNPDGVLITLDNEKHYQETLVKQGFKYVGEEVRNDMEFSEAPVEAPVDPSPTPVVTEKFLCDFCPFEGRNKHSLAIHRVKKHPPTV